MDEPLGLAGIGAFTGGRAATDVGAHLRERALQQARLQPSATPQPRDMTPIESVINECAGNIAELHQIVEELHRRLGPVLRPELNAEKAGGDGGTPGARSTIVHMVHTLALSVSMEKYRLIGLLERLEV